MLLEYISVSEMSSPLFPVLLLEGLRRQIGSLNHFLRHHQGGKCVHATCPTRSLKKSSSLLKNLFSTILQLASLQIQLAPRTRMANLLPLRFAKYFDLRIL